MKAKFNFALICRILLIIIIESACNESRQDLSNVLLIQINPVKAEESYLDDIAKNIECYNLQLPKDYYFGEIVDILPANDSLLLFHDYYNKQIQLFSLKGKFIHALNEVGRGPEEYLSIETFTTNLYNNQLIIYDHLGQKLVFYTLPDFKYVDKQNIPKSLISLAALSDNLLFTISDEDNRSQATHCDGAEIYNLKTKEFKRSHIPNEYCTVNLSYPRTISYTDHKRYYLCPSRYSIVYELTGQKQIPILRFDFGNKNLPDKLWENNNALEFEEIVDDNEYAFMPQYFLKQDSICSFFFFNGGPQEMYMAITKMQFNANPQIIKQIKIKGINTTVQLKPLGVFQDKYVCLLYPYQCEIVEEEVSTSPLSQLMRNKLLASPDEGTPILLMFQPQYHNP